ncbi:MAG TPA: hypothetical protein DEP82_10435 [Arthrobacter bacterium]|nr:hypothetical protein [Arthrobacter sp.]
MRVGSLEVNRSSSHEQGGTHGYRYNSEHQVQVRTHPGN